MRSQKSELLTNEFISFFTLLNTKGYVFLAQVDKHVFPVTVVSSKYEVTFYLTVTTIYD